MIVSVVENVSHELVGPDPFFFVDLLHGLVEVEVGNILDSFSFQERSGGVGFVPQHEDEDHVAAHVAELYHRRIDLTALVALGLRELHHHKLVLRGSENLYLTKGREGREGGSGRERRGREGGRERGEERAGERERESDLSARWQPSGGQKNKLCFPADVVPVFETLKRSCQYLSLKKGRASI